MEKSQDDIYQQRTEVFMLAMAFATELGYLMGVRYEDSDIEREWPVLVIEDLKGGEIAIHAKRADVHPALLTKYPSTKPYDGHTDAEKSQRIWQTLDDYWQ